MSNLNLGLNALCLYNRDGKVANGKERVECCMEHCIHPFDRCSKFCTGAKDKTVCMDSCLEQREMCTGMCINDVDDDIRKCMTKFECSNLDNLDLQCLERNRKNINDCCYETCKLNSASASCETDCEYLNGILKQYEELKVIMEKERELPDKLTNPVPKYCYVILTVIILILSYVYIKKLNRSRTNSVQMTN